MVLKPLSYAHKVEKQSIASRPLCAEASGRLLSFNTIMNKTLQLTIWPENTRGLIYVNQLHGNREEDVEWLANKMLSDVLKTHMSYGIPVDMYRRF